MERNIIWLLILLLLILEGAVFPFILPEIGNVSLHVKLVLVSVMLIGLLYHRYSALLYGICFGLLHDILYGQMIGVMAFSMGLTGYLISLIFYDKYESMVRDLFVLLIGNLFFELIVMMFHWLFELHQPLWTMNFFTQHLLPSLLLNLLFAASIYVPAKKYLHRMAIRYGKL